MSETRLRLLSCCLVFIVIMPAVPAVSKDRTGDAQYSEYQVKAAFLYNFIKFTDWPKDKPAEPNAVTVGILGDDSFGSAFDSVKDKSIEGKKLVIRRFGKFSDLCKDAAGDAKSSCADLEAMKKCHLLFVSKSERANFEQIIKAVSDSGVLTAGECDGFIESSGIVNLTPKADKIGFEINLIAARREKLKISSNVLRLAQRVISNEPAEADSPVTQE